MGPQSVLLWAPELHTRPQWSMKSIPKRHWQTPVPPSGELDHFLRTREYHLQKVGESRLCCEGMPQSHYQWLASGAAPSRMDGLILLLALMCVRASQGSGAHVEAAEIVFSFLGPWVPLS